MVFLPPKDEVQSNLPSDPMAVAILAARAFNPTHLSPNLNILLFLPMHTFLIFPLTHLAILLLFSMCHISIILYLL